MGNIWTDPFGLKLMKKPPPPAEPKALPPPAKPCPAPAYPYYCYNGYYPQPPPIFQQQIYLGNPCYYDSCHYPVPVPEAPSAAAVHQCVACTEKNKCKACKKKEKENKVYVSNPTFCNPRTSRKGVFER